MYDLAAMTLFGVATFNIILRAKLPVIQPVRLKPLRQLMIGLVAISACAWFVMAAAQMAGAITPQIMVQAAKETLFGRLFLARIVLLILLGLTHALSRNERLLASLAGLLIILPSFTSHVALSSPAGFSAVGASVDSLHVLAGAFWIGGLCVLMALYRRDDANILLALSLFSDWSMLVVLLLIMSGLINLASVLLGTPGRISWYYLLVLAAKLALVLLMLALAAANRFRLMPKLRMKAISRNVGREIAAGILVVLLAGWLAQLQPTL